MKIAKRMISLILVLLFASSMVAGDLEDQMKLLLEDNATSYVQPLVTAFGTSMNSGMFKKAKASTGLIPPFGIDFGIIVSVAEVSEDDMMYNYSLLENKINFPLSEISAELPDLEMTFGDIYNSSSDETPTIASEDDGVSLTAKTTNEIYAVMKTMLMDEHGFTETQLNAMEATIKSGLDGQISTLAQDFSFPGGLGISVLPVAMLQASVRVPLGIELSVRGIPEFDIPDIGAFKMFGIGLRKNIPVPIIDVSVGAAYQKMNIGDFFESTNMNYHAEVGKSLGIPGFKISPYAGVGFDHTSVTLSYLIDAGTVPGMEEDQELSFDMTGDNGMRITMGTTLQIPLIYINAEISKGAYQSATISAGFIFK